MAKARFKWNMEGFEAIRRSPEAVAYLRARVDRVAATAGDGFEARVDQAPGRKTLGRATARVIAVSPKARAQNAKRNILVRLIDQLGP